jgi:hypothetical protein
VSDSPTYWIARDACPEWVPTLSVYSAPPIWHEALKRWTKPRDGVLVAQLQEEHFALLGIESIPEPGRCVKLERSMRAFLDFCGEYAEGEALVPFVEDVTDELKGASR